MPILLVIPARFASSRYPGKPLVKLRGANGTSKSLIQRSWEAAMAAKGVDRVVVATDDERIRAHVKAFGAEVVMTSAQARNGTERCAEAHATLGGDYDVVVNLQGDAPLTPPWFVSDVVAGLANDPLADAATPMLNCTGAMRDALLAVRAEGRVGGTTAVFGADGRALYFSKEVIPFSRQSFKHAEQTPVFHHVGLYAYRAEALAAYSKWAPGRLELLEGLEQLRFLENARKLLCVVVDAKGRSFWELNISADKPKLEAMMKEMGIS